MVGLPPSYVIGSVTEPCVVHFKDVVTQRDIPPDLKGKVLDAIKSSPLVEPFIKKMIEKANPR